MTADDLVPRILAAIEETEQAAYGSGVVAWATYLHADGGMGYTSPVSGGGDLWFTAGEQTKPDSVKVIFDERAVLRRCAADRKLVELHRQSAELMWLCELCGGEGQNIDCTYPCDTLRLLAEGYGITPESRAVRGIDLSSVDLGELPQAERDRIAAKLAELPTTTLTFEAYFPRPGEDVVGVVGPDRPLCLLVCRLCGSGDVIMPFGTPEARGKWAAGHRDATGHDTWWVHDYTPKGI